MSEFNQILASCKKKTYQLFSLGCRVNQAEISVIGGYLEKLGFYSDKKNPDIIIINTCAVTKKALIESKRELLKLKRKYPKAKIIILGCGVEFKPQDFALADFLFNNIAKEKILDFNLTYSPAAGLPLARSKRHLLRIQSGCNNFCTYCLVPFLRNKLISISPNKIIKTIKKAEKLGFQEIILTGTNLELYGEGFGYNLSHLLEKILFQTKIPRIGLGSVNLEAIDDKFIRLYTQDWKQERGRLNRYLHIPLQSASNKILLKMNRPYKIENYQKVIKRLAKNIPFLGIGTDLVVGFPGETKKDFKKTVSFVKKMPFSRLHVFRYNPRPGTLSAKKETEWGSIENKIKQERAKVLRKIGEQKKKEFKKKIIGQKLNVLVLRKRKNYWQALTDNYVLLKIT
ncbi:MAG: MiaB/RimO family radical SAM methylthiotransferase [Candidatus Shapirobacteria bacterium]